MSTLPRKLRGLLHRQKRPSNTPEKSSSTQSTSHSITVASAEHCQGLRERLWNQAYDRLKIDEPDITDAYEKILSNELKQANSASADLPSQSNEIEQIPDRRWLQMEKLVQAGLKRTEKQAAVKQRIGNVIQATEGIKTLVDNALQAVPQAAVAWVGVCLTLQVLTSPVAEAVSNREGMAYVISRMEWYWNLSELLLEGTPAKKSSSKLNEQLEKKVVDLYRKLLLYQMKSVCVYYRKPTVAFLRDIVKLDDWDGTLKDIKDAEDALRKDSEQYTSQQVRSDLFRLANTAESQFASIYTAIQDQTSRQEKLHKSAEDRNCLRDLFITDPGDDKKRIQESKGGLLPDSYRWILDTLEYRQLINDTKQQLLWVKGDPGKGKTMLICGIIDELKESNPSSLVAFFFCQATIENLSKATTILRSLLYMLVTQQPSLIAYVRKRYDSAGKSLFDTESDYENSNTWTALSDIFIAILRDPTLKETYLIIDALDECVFGLQRLLGLIIDATSTLPHVKWIVSSRNWPSIEERLSRVGRGVGLSLEVNAKLVATAIDRYIHQQVQSLSDLKGYDNETMLAIQEHLMSNAEGTFLWVALVCQDLSRVSPWKAKDTLQKFPPGLDSLYGQMIRNIEQSGEPDLCKQILAVATAVRRPLILPELIQFVDLPKEVFERREWIEDLIQLCGSFLSLREEKVYFVHQSAKDYLVKDASGTLFPSELDKIHHHLLSRSLKLMGASLRRNLYDLHSPGCLMDEVSTPDPDPLATARYSCVYWVDHLFDALSDQRSCQVKVLDDDGEVLKFLEQNFLCWLETLSLCRSMSHGVTAMRNLEKLKSRMGPRLAELVRDANRFILSNRWIIENAPLQTYMSALLFSPDQSIVKKLFQKEVLSCVRLKTQIETEWNACLQTLEGHLVGVTSVAFSPDGKQLVSASWDCSIKIWDAESGSCLKSLDASKNEISAIAFSPDGSHLVSGSDKNIKVWNMRSGRCVQELEVGSGTIASIAVSANGKYLASGLEAGDVELWDMASCKRIWTMENRRNFEVDNPVVFSPDSRYLVSGCGDDIKIWEVTSGTCTQILRGHSGSIQAIAFSPDGKELVSVASDESLRVWDVTSGLSIQTLDGYENSVAFSPDGKQLASGTIDNSIQILDAVSKKCMQRLEGHNDKVEALAFSTDNKCLASGSRNCEIKIWDTIWDTASSISTQRQQGHMNWTNMIAFSPDGTLLVTGSASRDVKIWDVESGTNTHTWDDYCNIKNVTVFSPDSKQLASGTQYCNVNIWDIMPEAHTRTLKGHSSPDDTLPLPPRDKRTATLLEYFDNGIPYSVGGGLFPVSGAHDTWVMSLAFSPDGKLLAAGLYDCNIKIWNITTDICIQTLEGHDGSINAVDFSPDGKQLASASYDEDIRIWDLSSGFCTQTLKGHNSVVNTVAFSQCSNQLASGSDSSDCSVKVWDIASGACIYTLQCHNGSVNVVSFSLDDNLLASGSSDGIVKIWNAVSGECIQTTDVGVELSRISFKADCLLTDVGYITLPVVSSESTVASTQESQQNWDPSRSGYGIGTDRAWITLAGQGILWLPPEYRPRVSAVLGRTVAIGTASGRVLMVAFPH